MKTKSPEYLDKIIEEYKAYLTTNNEQLKTAKENLKKLIGEISTVHPDTAKDGGSREKTIKFLQQEKELKITIATIEKENEVRVGLVRKYYQELLPEGLHAAKENLRKSANEYPEQIVDSLKQSVTSEHNISEVVEFIRRKSLQRELELNGWLQGININRAQIYKHVLTESTKKLLDEHAIYLETVQKDITDKVNSLEREIDFKAYNSEMTTEAKISYFVEANNKLRSLQSVFSVPAYISEEKRKYYQYAFTKSDDKLQSAIKTERENCAKDLGVEIAQKIFATKIARLQPRELFVLANSHLQSDSKMLGVTSIKQDIEQNRIDSQEKAKYTDELCSDENFLESYKNQMKLLFQAELNAKKELLAEQMVMRAFGEVVDDAVKNK